MGQDFPQGVVADSEFGSAGSAGSFAFLAIVEHKKEPSQLSCSRRLDRHPEAA